MFQLGKFTSAYDLLYRDKDYHGEAHYVADLVRSHTNSCSSTHLSVLELGCGSGIHGCLLGELGFGVVGVDCSRDMINKAQERREHLPRELLERISFHVADVRTLRMQGSVFDAVISLFHVMSYMITDEDFAAAFATARAHLKAGGVFIFDVWHGPAVLAEPPSRRVKHAADDSIEVTRYTEPVWHPEENIVDVNFTFSIRDNVTNGVQEVKETHKLRYYFTRELEEEGSKQGFRLLIVSDWMTDLPASAKTFGVCYVFQATATGQEALKP